MNIFEDFIESPVFRGIRAKNDSNTVLNFEGDVHVENNYVILKEYDVSGVRKYNFYKLDDFSTEELELIRYDLRAVKNNFSANGFLILPRVESDEERQQLLNNIKNSFVGSDNANALCIAFSNGDENDSNIAKFVKIDKDSNNVNLFSESNERNIDRIVTAHRIPTKALIGMPIEGASLGGGGNELNVSWNLYNATVATTNRNAILTTINKMFAMNGVDTEIKMKPLDFNLIDKTDTTMTTTPIINKIGYDQVKNNNIEEKAVNKDEQR